MGNSCCKTAEAKAMKASKKEFKLHQTRRKSGLTHEEVEVYIEKHAELWAMLSVNLNIEEAKCKEIATRVAFAIGQEENDIRKRKSVMTVKEFHTFRSTVLENPKGQQDFFQRTVFAAYDQDHNGKLDSTELDKFLDLFYSAGSIFKGDVRLPPKSELKEQLYSRLNKDQYQTLTFEELRDVISGNYMRTLCGNTNNKL